MLFELNIVFALGDLPLAPMGPTCIICTTLNSLSLRMIPAKFGKNPTMRFQEDDERVTFLY